MDAVLKFFKTVEKNNDRTILYVGLKGYTCGMITDRCNEILKKADKMSTKDVLAVSSEDPIERIAAYLTAVKMKAGYLSLPPNMNPAQKKEMQEILHMQGNIPVNGISGISIRERGADTAEEGEAIFQTSGTSGNRKYVRIPHHTFFERLLQTYAYDRIEEERRRLLLFPVWKQLGLRECLRSLYQQKTLYIPAKTEIPDVFELLASAAITDIIIKPSFLAEIIYHPAFKKDCLEHVKSIRYCQEPIQMKTLIQIQSLFPEIQLFSDYGLTETVGTIAVMGPEMHQKAKKDHYLPTIARFTDGTEAIITDERGKILNAGKIGELKLHTPWQFTGYIGETQADNWIATGDMGWMDTDGCFNLSGFKRKNIKNRSGLQYVLPATAREQFVSVPLTRMAETVSIEKKKAVQGLIILVHETLNVDKIKATYMEMIPDIISMDAYGFDLFPLDLQQKQKSGWINAADQSWYQDALHISSGHMVSLSNQEDNRLSEDAAVSVESLEKSADSALNIIYIPLYSQNSQMHGLLSFARYADRGSFTSEEITLLKELSHHLNLAILNARLFREVQTRQMMLQETMHLSETGIILSDLDDTIYFMSGTISYMLKKEAVPPLGNSMILDAFKSGLNHLRITGNREYHSRFICDFRESLGSSWLNIRTVRIFPGEKYAVTFISPGLENDNMKFSDMEKLLSPKEQSVLTGLCKGYSYKKIAEKMCISINTVNFHIKNIYRKLNVNSKSELLAHVLYLGENGLRYAIDADRKEKADPSEIN